jgi:hypothetical protein
MNPARVFGAMNRIARHRALRRQLLEEAIER